MSRWVQAWLVVGLVGAGAVVAPPPATAAGPVVFRPTITEDVVDPDDGELSLREAVDLANDVEGTAADPPVVIVLEDPAVDDFDVPLDYRLTRCDGTRVSEDDTNDQGDLDYDGGRPLQLLGWSRGPEPRTAVTQACPAASGERVIDVTSLLELRGVELSGGDAAGDGGGVRAGSVFAAQSMVRSNRSAGDGGGISATGRVTLDDVGAVFANVAAGDGGGIATSGAVELSVGFWSGPSVGANEAGGNGGGIAADSFSAGRETSVHLNEAGGDGGGVYTRQWAGGFQRRDPLRVWSNSAGGSGGGVHVETGEVQSVDVVGNTAAVDGGGIWAGGSATIDKVTVSENSASGDGGGLWIGGSTEVTWSRIFQNHADTQQGGGVFASTASDLELSDSVVRENGAANGAGVFAEGAGVIERVHVVDNVASGSGGGVEVRGAGPSRLSSSLVAGNVAPSSGGGVRVEATGGDHLVHLSSLVDNDAAGAANLSLTPAADVRVAGTVLASPGGGGLNCTSGVALGAPAPSAPAGAKGRQPSYSTDASCLLQAAGSTVGGVDPGLDPATYVPAWDSPLRGAVQLPAGTQVLALTEELFPPEDGLEPSVVRPVGAGADIGAFEGGEPLVHAVAPLRVLDTRKPSPAPLGAGGERVVQISGLAGVPAGATGVVANVTVVDPTAATHLTVWPGGPRPSVSNVNAPAGATVASSAVVRLSDTGSVTVRNNAGSAHVLIDVVGWVDGGTDTTGWAVTPVAPTRLINTRSGAPFSPGQVRTFDVDGGVVPAGAEAVVVNLTGVEASVATHLTAWEAGTTAPSTSTVNLAAGATVANLAVVPLDAQGRLSIRNNAGSVHVLGDVVAYLDEVAPASSTDGGLFSLVPRRAFDSRSPGSGGPFAGGVTRTVDLATAGGPVPGHARAAVVTLTVVGPSATTHLTAWASGAPRPATSNVNVPAGVTRANTAVVPLDGDGEIDLRIASGTAHVIVDVVGYLP